MPHVRSSILAVTLSLSMIAIPVPAGSSAPCEEEVEPLDGLGCSGSAPSLDGGVTSFGYDGTRSTLGSCTGMPRNCPDDGGLPI